MGVVGSLPSPPPPPPSTASDTKNILYEESISSSDECDYCILKTDEMDSNTNCSSNSNIDNENKSNSHKHPERKSPITVTYGPISVKIRQSTLPTLATGRCSKFLKLEGDAALKRELRRRKNREAAKRLKEKRMNIEQNLAKDIQQLESKEQDLLSRIKNLETYKEQLELQHRLIVSIQEKVARTASSTLKHIEHNHQQLQQNLSIYPNYTDIKEEPRSVSPQWQLLFSI